MQALEEPLVLPLRPSRIFQSFLSFRMIDPSPGSTFSLSTLSSTGKGGVIILPHIVLFASGDLAQYLEIQCLRFLKTFYLDRANIQSLAKVFLPHDTTES